MWVLKVTLNFDIGNITNNFREFVPGRRSSMCERTPPPPYGVSFRNNKWKWIQKDQRLLEGWYWMNRLLYIPPSGRSLNSPHHDFSLTWPSNEHPVSLTQCELSLPVDISQYALLVTCWLPDFSPVIHQWRNLISKDPTRDRIHSSNNPKRLFPGDLPQ